MDWGAAFLHHFWEMSIEASPYLLFGFAAATLLHVFLPPRMLLRFLGRGKVRPTLTAAAVGIPLPLCSCSVVPTALAIREKGASPGATLAFFISTPETGVDSIALTYGIMGPFGPILAAARPAAAGVSAIAAGLALDAITQDSPPDSPSPSEPSQCCGEKKNAATSDCSSAASITTPVACCSETIQERAKAPAAEPFRQNSEGRGVMELAKRLGHSFTQLFDEIAWLIALGLAFSAIIAAALPDDLGLSARMGSPLVEMGLAVLIGLPMYVCATASTPLAAVLIAKGLSPGAALVFLLVGPATNIGTIAIVRRMLGNQAVVIYLTSIIGVSVLFGLGVNWLCQDLTLDFSAKPHDHSEGILGVVSATFLWFLLIWRVWVEFGRKRRQKT